MGHYALCGHLLPFLGRSDRPTRVVSVSSLAHRLGNPVRLLQELRVDGSEIQRLPVEVASSSHYLYRGFIHPFGGFNSPDFDEPSTLYGWVKRWEFLMKSRKSHLGDMLVTGVGVCMEVSSKVVN